MGEESDFTRKYFVFYRKMVFSKQIINLIPTPYKWYFIDPPSNCLHTMHVFQLILMWPISIWRLTDKATKLIMRAKFGRLLTELINIHPMTRITNFRTKTRQIINMRKGSSFFFLGHHPMTDQKNVKKTKREPKRVREEKSSERIPLSVFNLHSSSLLSITTRAFLVFNLFVALSSLPCSFNSFKSAYFLICSRILLPYFSVFSFPMIFSNCGEDTYFIDQQTDQFPLCTHWNTWESNKNQLYHIQKWKNSHVEVWDD